MRMPRSCPLALAIVLACVPALAVAQDPALAKAADAAFQAADFDGNGKVSWEEFRNRVVKVFGHLDHNEDGRIAGDEHPPAVGKDGKEVQPGNVTAESFTSAVGEAFKAADKDGDGELSAQEWSGKQP
ncbi:MAG: EF-hand domain-containing protein [Pseudomonadota bacterium]|jgi:Ca2+-binding EF-hand superfamily protein